MSADSETTSLRQCVACGAMAPTTQTSYTLISSEHGWRLSRSNESSKDKPVMVWRCPKCWARYKALAAKH